MYLDMCRGDIGLLRDFVEEKGPNCESAKCLRRRGLHPLHECTAILDDCSNATLSIPGRLFGGLFAYDIMHTVFIGAIGYLLEAILDLLTPSQKSQLDSRSNKLSPFRTSVGGISYVEALKMT